MCRLVEGGSGRGFGTENIRDVLSRAPPGETPRPPIVYVVIVGEAQCLGVDMLEDVAVGVEISLSKRCQLLAVEMSR